MADDSQEWDEGRLGFEQFVDLVDSLYYIHPVGGPLHVVLDDGNIDGVIEPYWGTYADIELDTLYYQGIPLDQLSPQAPAVTEGLGRSMRQLCNDIAALMNSWTEDQREMAFEALNVVRRLRRF